MKMEMYLEGKLVDTTELVAGAVQSDRYFRALAEDLLIKHQVLVAHSKKEPSFMLCGRHSSMKYFVTLTKDLQNKARLQDT